MSLVAYPASDSDEADPHPPKRRRPSESPALPPLPSSFHNLYAANSRVSVRDDPSLHQGRKRAVPHVQGNWPTHVQLEWHPNLNEAAILNDLVARIQDTQISAQSDHANESTPAGNDTTANSQDTLQNDPGRVHSLLLSPLSAPLPLHVSLSRSLVLKTQQRDDFLDAVTARIRASGVRPFTVRFGNPKWVPNFERTRWFLVVGLEQPEHDELNRLLVACNDASRAIGLGALYDRDEFATESKDAPVLEKKKKYSADFRESADRSERFHVSLAWKLEPPSDELLDPLADPQVAKLVRDSISDALSLRFNEVKVKIGNAVHSLDLCAKAVVESTAFI